MSRTRAARGRQARLGDHLSKDERYERTGEFLSIVRGARSGTPYDFDGKRCRVDGATVAEVPEPAAR
ncbi:hypothetical protein ACQPYK_19385 [Streptosporangium sp. CA-135522]|uniref:hypothetical protein n=1 Tax=Streptosporangium sp. CA-135522 TaxID=3240072 RepID=UPI003D8B8EFF